MVYCVLDLHVCETSQMKCNQSRPPRCIAASRRCDGERDCNMGEDEADCRKYFDLCVRRMCHRRAKI